MQTLRLADDLFEQVDDGKGVAIRMGRKPIQCGPLLLQGVRDTDLQRLVHVVEVRCTRLDALTEHDLDSYPVKAVADLAESLRRHYPDIQPASVVTYVRFEPFWNHISLDVF